MREPTKLASPATSFHRRHVPIFFPVLSAPHCAPLAPAWHTRLLASPTPHLSRSALTLYSGQCGGPRSCGTTARNWGEGRTREVGSWGGQQAGVRSGASDAQSRGRGTQEAGSAAESLLSLVASVPAARCRRSAPHPSSNTASRRRTITELWRRVGVRGSRSSPSPTTRATPSRAAHAPQGWRRDRSGSCGPTAPSARAPRSRARRPPGPRARR